MNKIMHMIFFICIESIFGWNNGGHALMGQITEMILGQEKMNKIREHLYPLESFHHSWQSMDTVMDPHHLFEVSTWMATTGHHVFPFIQPWGKVASPIRKDNVHCEEHSLGNNDSIYAVKEALNILKKPTSSVDDNVSSLGNVFWLRVLMNIMGEFHQPLNNCNMCNKQFPHGDRNGQDWTIVTDVTDKSDGPWNRIANLHHLWEFAGGLYQNDWPLRDIQKKELIKQAKDIVQEFPASEFHDINYVDETDLRRWHTQHKQMCEKIYEQVPFGQPVTKSFIDFVHKSSRRQIALGAYRLAQMLSNIASVTRFKSSKRNSLLKESFFTGAPEIPTRSSLPGIVSSFGSGLKKQDIWKSYTAKPARLPSSDDFAKTTKPKLIRSLKALPDLQNLNNSYQSKNKNLYQNNHPLSQPPSFQNLRDAYSSTSVSEMVRRQLKTTSVNNKITSIGGKESRNLNSKPTMKAIPTKQDIIPTKKDILSALPDPKRVLKAPIQNKNNKASKQKKASHGPFAAPPLDMSHIFKNY